MDAQPPPGLPGGPLNDERDGNQPTDQPARSPTAKPSPFPCNGPQNLLPPTIDFRPVGVGDAGPIFPKLPCTFGCYRVLERLGSGGMGSVFLAHDNVRDMKVALKVARCAAEDGSDFADRLLREARFATRLQHEGLCRALDCDKIDGICYLAMDYVPGRPLSDLLKSGQPLPERQAAEIALKVARAMHVAHEAGVIHRDLKPANIILDSNDRPTVVDFGLALHWLTPTSTERVLAGTKEYMSPEQAKSADLDRRTDVYSLGAVLYHMLTNRVPFPGSNLLDVVHNIVYEKLDLPGTHRHNLDSRLDAICCKALAREPADRYASMQELADDLEAFLAPRPRRWRWVAAAVALLALTGALALFLGPFRSNGPHAPHRVELDVHVWKAAELGQMRNLGAPGVLPLKAGDYIQIVAKAGRPAYFYIVQLESTGTVAPLHPWQDYDWKRPGPEQPHDWFRWPDDPVKNAAPLSASPSGIEAIFLLARDTPLSAEEHARLPALFGNLSGGGKADLPRGVIWLSDRDPPRTTRDEDRGRLDAGQAKGLNDPIDRVRTLLRTELPRFFSECHAVCYAFEGP